MMKYVSILILLSGLTANAKPSHGVLDCMATSSYHHEFNFITVRAETDNWSNIRGSLSGLETETILLSLMDGRITISAQATKFNHEYKVSAQMYDNTKKLRIATHDAAFARLELHMLDESNSHGTDPNQINLYCYIKAQ